MICLLIMYLGRYAKQIILPNFLTLKTVSYGRRLEEGYSATFKKIPRQKAPTRLQKLLRVDGDGRAIGTRFG